MQQYELIQLEEVTSTQTYLIDKDESLALQEFTTVYTNKQTLGRGQGTNKWESEKGKNISFSFLLRPTFLNPSNQYLITKIISLAIVEVLQDYGIENVKIKWPNDIYVNENKICGILVQNKIIGNELSAVYVGIGININQTKFSFALNPTSFFLEMKKEYSKEEVFQACMQRIISLYEEFKTGKLNNIDKKYLNNLLFLNQKRKYEYNGKLIEAEIKDINEYGHLVLEGRELDSKEEKPSVFVAELRELKFLF